MTTPQDIHRHNQTHIETLGGGGGGAASSNTQGPSSLAEDAPVGRI